MHATALDISDAEVRARSERLVARLSDEDPSLWSAAADHQAEIANLLGWIRIAERIEPEARAISQWAAEVSAEIDDVVLLGMGGSSLAPEVMAAMLPPAAGRPRLTVLDSTDPATVRRVSGAINLERTLFIVASKSGGTLETAVLYATFRAQFADRNLSDAGSHFIAITDPDTSLARRASDEGFARTFLNDSRIGGRYSALSYFGLVPAALVGLDVGIGAGRSRRIRSGGPARDEHRAELGHSSGSGARRAGAARPRQADARAFGAGRSRWERGSSN